MLGIEDFDVLTEPASLTLLGLGLASMGARRWRSSSATNDHGIVSSTRQGPPLRGGSFPVHAFPEI